jgi:hypothetical protein
MPFISSVRGSYGAQGRFGRKAVLGSGSTGGTITTAGGYRIHTFATTTRVGATYTFTPDASGVVEYLIVAGGGGGGRYGGGGAGGLLSGTSTLSNQNYSIVVGAGGYNIGSPTPSTADSGPSEAINGENTTALGQTAIGGGWSNGADGPGQNGGSGGGGGHGASGVGSSVGGLGTPGQGNNGGNGFNVGNQYGGGGGGGAGAVGVNATQGQAGNGGAGLSNSISGTSLFYASGGGSSSFRNEDGAGIGANSVGGNGSKYGASGPISIIGTNAVHGRGGGGGGAMHGGSGTVIIRYPI